MATKTKSKARLDGNRLRLKKGEYQRKNGTYEFRWTTEDGVRHMRLFPYSRHLFTRTVLILSNIITL